MSNIMDWVARMEEPDEIERLRSLNAALVEALEGLQAAYTGVKLHATQEQIAAMVAAGNAAVAALKLAKETEP